jgi:2-methylcitrate dehydratase PrpD
MLIDDFAAFGAGLRADGIPDEVKALACDHVLDTIGASLAAAGTHYADVLESGAASLGGDCASRVLGSARTYPAEVAALLNGSLSHGNDYDDSFIEGIVHPTGAVLAAALAMLDHVDPGGSTSQDLIAAVVAGVEVTCRIARIVGPELVAHGVHPTSACGVLGATVAAGRAAGLTAEQLGNALALAAGTSGGMHQSTVDGSWNKWVHPGLAARAAVLCCELARAGMTAPRGGLEDDSSWLRTFGLPETSLAPAAIQLGSRWESTQVAIKVYPACQGVHPYVDCAIDLHEHSGLDPADVHSINLRVGRKVGLLLCEPATERRHPSSGGSAKLSLPYTVAYALRHGLLPEEAFTWGDDAEESVLELARRVRWEVDEDFDRDMALRGLVTVTTSSGVQHSAEVEHCRGTWQNPATETEVEAKFLRNVESRLGARARVVIGLIRDIEALPSGATLFDACVVEELVATGRA